MKNLANKRVSKKYKFMGEEVTIAKLSVAQVMEIQNKAKGLSEESEEGFDVLRTVIQLGVEEANDLSDEDFENFPMDELSRLSQEIMKFSGLGEQKGK